MLIADYLMSCRRVGALVGSRLEAVVANDDVGTHTTFETIYFHFYQYDCAIVQYIHCTILNNCTCRVEFENV